MKHRIVLAAGAVWLATAAAAHGADPTPAGQFSGMASVETPSGTRSMAFAVVVQRPITLAEAQPLKKVLAESGQQGLLNSIRGGNRGYFDLGGVTYPIDLVVAEPKGDGFVYVVVTTRALRYEEVQEGSASLEHPFTVVAFEVPGFGSGTGHISTKAALSIDADGRVHVEQYGAKPGTVKDVKRRSGL